MSKPTASAASPVVRSQSVTAEWGRPRPAEEVLPVLPRLSADRLRFEIFAKATLDRSLAVLIAFPAVPVMLLCMALVKLTSRGPALYSQKRVGQFGRVFTIWKIRTMYHNCEKLTGPRWCTPGDPRVTRVGKVLRALHLDELPQLANVLRGEMSLVGPRPERPEIAARLSGLVTDYNSRHVVLPGITGNAQIHLPPDTNVNDVRDKLVLDREYVRRFTAWFDFKMLALTGLKMVGVYRPGPFKGV